MVIITPYSLHHLLSELLRLLILIVTLVTVLDLVVLFGEGSLCPGSLKLGLAGINTSLHSSQGYSWFRVCRGYFGQLQCSGRIGVVDDSRGLTTSITLPC